VEESEFCEEKKDKSGEKRWEKGREGTVREGECRGGEDDKKKKGERSGEHERGKMRRGAREKAGRVS